MPATPAQIAASRANGSNSRGPATAEGRAISRRNALKHGMAGAGIVMPDNDAAEVERRSAAMLDEMRPASEMGRYLVNRLARLTVRVERCASQELAAHAHLVAHAEEAFDEARIAEVDRLMSDLGAAPETSTRRLRSMPEGVDRMVAVLLELREALDRGDWDVAHGERFAHLSGASWDAVPAPPVRLLTEGLARMAKSAPSATGSTVRAAIAALIEAEVALLLEHREALDLEAIELDRATAADRVGFEPSKEMLLARRYEAAADRGVFRALKELRRVEAEAVEVAARVEPEEAGPGAPGSFGAGDPTHPRVPLRAPIGPAPTRPTPDRGVVTDRSAALGAA